MKTGDKMNYTDCFVMIFSIITIAFILYACVLIIRFIFEIYYKDSEEPTEKPTEEKRYVYVIFGKDLPSKSKLPYAEVRCKYVESDIKLTYQELKDKFPSIEIMSINKLDRKTGKF